MFIGAFFLINLLLAVINSQFATIKAQELKKVEDEKAKKKLGKSKKKVSDDGFEFD